MAHWHYLVGRFIYLHLDVNLATHVSMHPIYIELFKYVHRFVCMIFASTCKFSDASAFGVFKIEIGIAIDAFKY